jgi:hypothetical protein
VELYTFWDSLAGGVWGGGGGAALVLVPALAFSLSGARAPLSALEQLLLPASWLHARSTALFSCWSRSAWKELKPGHDVMRNASENSEFCVVKIETVLAMAFVDGCMDRVVTSYAWVMALNIASASVLDSGGCLSGCHCRTRHL